MAGALGHHGIGDDASKDSDSDGYHWRVMVLNHYRGNEDVNGQRDEEPMQTVANSFSGTRDAEQESKRSRDGRTNA